MKIEMMPAPAKDVLLSIITVVRNDFKRLAATINSLESLYGDDRFEHVVIDGNSTDQKTLDLVWETKKHKNYQCLSEPDGGIYDAMNKGARLAGGRFLLFLNCGDRMAASPGQLDVWLRTLDQAHWVDVVCFSCRVHHDADVALLKPLSGTLHKMPTSHQAMLFSMGFVRAHPYDTRYHIAADFNLYLSANKGRILTFDNNTPLTDIEAIGVASENPLLSYKEYLLIANRKLHGREKWMALVRIGYKSIAVIFLKKVLPRAWAHELRRLM